MTQIAGNSLVFWYPKIMKIKLIFLVISAFWIFSGEKLQAESQMPPQRQEFFQKLNSETLHIVDEQSPYFKEGLGDYPWLAKIIQNDIWKYHPQAQGSVFPKECSAETLHAEMISPPPILDEKSPREDLQIFSEKKTACEGAWTSRAPPFLVQLYKLLSISLDPDNYAYGRNVILKLPQGVILKGFLAMKADRVKRPLIVFRAGIFSNTQEFYPERAYLIQLFEQSSFNFLLLESSSGADFIKHNQALSFGGFDEGMENLWVAQKLKNSNEPISQFIGDVHLAGMSFGGHGIFSALWLAEYQRTTPIFQSALALCPLVHFAETFAYHNADPLMMKILNFWSSRRIRILKDRYPQLTNENFVTDLLALINSSYKQPLIYQEGSPVGGEALSTGEIDQTKSGVQTLENFENHSTVSQAEPSSISSKAISVKGKDILIPEFLIKEFSDSKDLFWRLNDYWKFFEKDPSLNVKTPLMILTTETDPIVPLLLNTARLNLSPSPLAHWNMKHFNFKEGFHCSFSSSYDWSVMTTLMNTYFQKRSPHWKTIPQEISWNLPPDFDESLNGKYLQKQMTAEVGDAAITLTIQFTEEMWPTWKDRLIGKTYRFQIPLKNIDYSIDSVFYSTSELRAVLRWARQNIQLQVDHQKLTARWGLGAETGPL